MAQIIVKLWRSCGTSWTKLVRWSMSRIAVGKTIRRSFIRTWMEKIPNWECMFVHRKQGLSLSVHVDVFFKMDGKKHNMAPMWKKLMNKCGSWRTNIISWPRIFGMYSTWMQTEWNNYWENSKMFESKISAGATENLLQTWRSQHHFLTMCTWDALRGNANRMKQSLNSTQICLSHVFLLEQHKNYRGGKNLTHKQKRCLTTWKDMLKNALSDTANWQTRKWSNCTKFQALAWMIINSSRKNSNQLENCQRSVTRWTQACDRRLARLISYIHHTNDFRQYCHVGNTAQHCKLGLFQDSDFAGDLEDTKSTSGGVPVSWMCKKQTSVSHSSTESEVLSLDAGLRVDGSPARDLWGHGDWSVTFN